MGAAGGLRGRSLASLAYPPDEELAHAAVQGEADSSDRVLTAAVQTICHFTRCAMGQVGLPAGSVLVCSPTWYCSGHGFEKLHAASEEVSYELGGLPGLAWAKGQPLQLDDIRDSAQSGRAVAAGPARPQDAPHGRPGGAAPGPARRGRPRPPGGRIRQRPGRLKRRAAQAENDYRAAATRCGSRVRR